MNGTRSSPDQGETQVPSGVDYVLAHGGLRHWHAGFDAEPKLTRHSTGQATPWTDSLAFTHCICFAAAARTAGPLVALLQRIRAGWLPHRLSAGTWWWGRPSDPDGFKLWSMGLVPTMIVVHPMTDDEVAVWTATLHTAAPEVTSG